MSLTALLLATPIFGLPLTPPTGVANASGNLVGVASNGCSDGRLRVNPGAANQSYLLDKSLGPAGRAK